MDGDHALAAQVIAEMETNPLTTFVSLMLKEEKKQAEDDKKATGAVVDDTQCKR